MINSKKIGKILELDYRSLQEVINLKECFTPQVYAFLYKLIKLDIESFSYLGSVFDDGE